MAKHFHSCCFNCYITGTMPQKHHNDNIEGLLTRAYPIFSDAQTPVDDRYEARCRNKLRCLSREYKFFHCAANTLIFSGFEAKNAKASGASPQAPTGELTALPHTRVGPAPGRPSNQPPPYSPIPRSATGFVGVVFDRTLTKKKRLPEIFRPDNFRCSILSHVTFFGPTLVLSFGRC